MTTPRKIALWFLGVVAFLLVVLAVVPLLFRDQIVARVKTAINGAVNARVDWKDAGVTFFHDFPSLTLRLDGLAVSGVGAFRGDTLAAMDRFRLVLELGSVLAAARGTGPVVVKAIELDRPTARLLVLPDGRANWDIVKPSPPSQGPTRPLAVKLRDLEVSDGTIALDNRQTGLLASLAGLRESLRGDFRQTRFTLKSQTTADTVSLRFAGVPYLNRVRLDVGVNMDVDMGAKRVAVKENHVRLNDLAVGLTGAVAAASDSAYDVDLAFRAPRTDFKELLSLVPAVYRKDFSGIQTSGTMALSGWVRGRYGPKAFPALALSARVENGMFRYPDLPLPARDIALDVALSNPGGSVDGTVLDLKRFHVVLGNNPVDGSLLVRTPVSDPDVALRVAGRVDLADVARTVKLEKVDRLAGTVVANASVKARVSDVNQKRYDRVAAAGSVDVSGLAVQARDLPRAVQIDHAALRLSPQRAELADFRGRIGRSDLSATGSLDNLVGYLFHNEALRGQARVASGYFDLNEWRSNDKMQAIAVPANLDFALDASAGRVSYGKLDLRDARGSLQIKDQRVTLQNFSMNTLGGTMTVSGFYETTNPAKPTFDLDLHAASMDVPGAFNSITTFQAFVPVARYAKGSASADMKLNGALGQDMMPVLGVLSALGSFKTAGLALQGFPPLDKLADMLKVGLLKDPGFKDLSSSFEIKDGKLRVKPFDVKVGQLTMNVAGSNGIDQSLQYVLGLALPRAALGAEANDAVTRLVARSSQAGLDLKAADVVNLAVQLGGTVTRPTLSTSLRQTGAAAATAVQQALVQEAGRRVDTLQERATAAATAASEHARADAARVIAQADTAAAKVRAQAQALADAVRAQGHARADSLAARPTDPIAKIAAKAAADRLRKETDTRADQIVKEANARADSLVAAARTKAAAIAPPK